MARVLVCDDDPGIRDLLEVTVALEHDVRSAVNGRDLLAKIDEDPSVDVIVCDVMMPEMDGFEALRQIRARPDVSDVVMIMLSARVADHDLAQAYAAGADAYVTKPFETEHLLAVVQDVVEGAEAVDRGLLGRSPRPEPSLPR